MLVHDGIGQRLEGRLTERGEAYGEREKMISGSLRGDAVQDKDINGGNDFIVQVSITNEMLMRLVDVSNSTSYSKC